MVYVGIIRYNAKKLINILSLKMFASDNISSIIYCLIHTLGSIDREIIRPTIIY